MELLLNLAWLTVAGTAVAFFYFSAPDQKRRVLGLAALGCALLLLFPAISASDDLRSNKFVAEDSSVSKRLTDAAARATHTAQSLVLFLATGPLALGLGTRVWSLTGSVTVSFLSVHLHELVPGRAPPAAFLA